MLDWRRFLQDGHQFDFYSPQSLQTCADILRDQSRRNYFRSTYFDWLVYRKKSNVLFVDVHPQSPHHYTFRVERDFGLGKSLVPSAITGKLEQVGTTTHVVGKVSKRNGDWIFWIIVIIIVDIGGLVTFIQSMLSGNWRFATTILSILPFGIAMQWLIVIRPFWRFIHCVERWLGVEINRIHYEESALSNLFRRSFDFYTTDSPEKCVDVLSHPSYQGRYQYTTHGMIKGAPLDGGLFIATAEHRPDCTDFLIQYDEITYTYHYRVGAQMIGRIQSEGDMTRVRGYVYVPRDWEYIGLLVLALLITACWVTISTTLIIAMVLGIMGYLVTQYIVNQIFYYPHEKILGRPPQIKRGTLDFHSPYPIEDVVNMLLNYSEPQDYETPWGIGKGVRIDDELLVVLVAEKDIYRLMVGFDGAKTRSVYDYLQVHATLRQEGYGTRVVGGHNRRVGSETLWAGMIATLFVVFVLMFTTNISFIPIVSAVIGIGTIGFHIHVKKNAQMLLNYPQHILSGKAIRKQKVADTPKSE